MSACVLACVRIRPCTAGAIRTAGKNKDRNSRNYRRAERDGHIHHPRSFEYRGAERRTRQAGSTKTEDGSSVEQTARKRRPGSEEERHGKM